MLALLVCLLSKPICIESIGTVTVKLLHLAVLASDVFNPCEFCQKQCSHFCAVEDKFNDNIRFMISIFI